MRPRSWPVPMMPGTARTITALTGAALTGAALTGAALTGAALTGAALAGAALAGAALTGAAITWPAASGAAITWPAASGADRLLAPEARRVRRQVALLVEEDRLAVFPRAGPPGPGQAWLKSYLIKMPRTK